jgi:hypothetical protein
MAIETIDGSGVSRLVYVTGNSLDGAPLPSQLGLNEVELLANVQTGLAVTAQESFKHRRIRLHRVVHQLQNVLFKSHSSAPMRRRTNQSRGPYNMAVAP